MSNLTDSQQRLVTQYHIVFIKKNHRWVLKTDDNDIPIRSSYYKFLIISKAIKFCKTNKPSELVIHTKDGHQEESRNYK